MNPHDLDVAQAFIFAHPQAAARELEGQPLAAAVALVEALSLPALRKLSPHILSTFMARMCALLPLDFAAAMLADASVTRCSTVLRCIPKRKRGDILDALPEKSAALARLMLSYSQDSVGAHMNPHILMLSTELHAGQALNLIAGDYGQGEMSQLPVVDHLQRPVASVGIRALLRARSTTPIARLVGSALPTISSRATLSAAAASDAFKGTDTAWVLNRDKQLIGLLKHRDLRVALLNTSTVPLGKQGSDLIEGFGSAYGGTLVALLDLFRPDKRSQEEDDRAHAVLGEHS